MKEKKAILRSRFPFRRQINRGMGKVGNNWGFFF